MKKIVVQFNIPSLTAEKYSQTLKDLEAAGKEKSARRLNHVAAEQPKFFNN